MNPSPGLITILTPCRNERENVRGLHERIAAVMAAYASESESESESEDEGGGKPRRPDCTTRGSGHVTKALAYRCSTLDFEPVAPLLVP